MGKSIIYLDQAATSFPKPPKVITECARCMREYCGNPGRGGHTLSLAASEKLFDCRAALAEFFDLPAPENVVFTHNTTYALNMAIKCFIQPGAHVLISDLEHNSVLRPVNALAQRGMITYDIFSSAGGNTGDIIASIYGQLKPNTQAIICTHASNITGMVLPIREIGAFCREHGIRFIVDGAQSAGIYPISMQEMSIDILCIPAHKGLYGPQGAGAMLLGPDIGMGKTFLEGGNGINSLEISMPDFLPERYEAGTMATPAIAGWMEGIRFISARGMEQIRTQEHTLCMQAEKLLRKNDRIIFYQHHTGPSSILLFNIAGIDSGTVAESLDRRGICVRSGFHCSPLAHRTVGTRQDGAIRVSFGAFNRPSDCEALAGALEEICRQPAK